ncbi:MAG: FGGY-family carbohydrate kinase, partial [Acidobacteriota bacterium]|nr:FGGY-family carbohydrate kinase [Acidobacteriota bacterium]
VAFSLRDSIEIFKELNIPIETIKLGGGGAHSALWRQIQADVYGQTVEIVEAEEGAAYGAALLAGVGGGFWKTIDEACSLTIKSIEKIYPNSTTVEFMNRQYKAYKEIYPSLNRIMEIINLNTSFRRS